ncbi:hypothetical protein SKAU_G00133440 [Synaphobranchus kaupii]|uniref:Phorbol-ester/DAG-type domain-containing protein n=1 Tax=Synaphobranchus kaupii TaxID=118154 RepID=A0A9Q1FR24_SYNKA|nr:hypothetical protein SKAU_G00133440 [Synaphobranchus kaupii]
MLLTLKRSAGTKRATNRGKTRTEQTSKLQRLKRSLSFKSVMRSKSMENFFLRTNSEARLPPDFITDPPPPSPPLLLESPLAGDCSPSLSPNPSLCSHSPSLSPSPSLSSKPPVQLRPLKMHCFQEHVFRRPTHCQLCKHMIVGNSKQGLRCKACKLGAHLWCSSELSQQPCNGKITGLPQGWSINRHRQAPDPLLGQSLPSASEMEVSQPVPALTVLSLSEQALSSPPPCILKICEPVKQASRAKGGNQTEPWLKTVASSKARGERNSCGKLHKLTPTVRRTSLISRGDLFRTLPGGARAGRPAASARKSRFPQSGAFKRNFSSPLLVNEQLGVVKEAPANQESAGKGRVDPVYEALRYGTSLAQMSRSSIGSISESPTRSMGEGGEEKVESQPPAEEEKVQETTEVLTPSESEDRVSLKV